MPACAALRPPKPALPNFDHLKYPRESQKAPGLRKRLYEACWDQNGRVDASFQLLARSEQFAGAAEQVVEGATRGLR